MYSKTVVVIGGSSGLGWAVAEAAAGAGARVTAISRSGNGPHGAAVVAAEVTDRRQLADALGSVTIDHLVYTAGARLGSPPLDTLDDGTLHLGFETKLFAAIQADRFALPHLASEASVTLTSGQLSRKYGVGSLLKGSVNAAIEGATKHLAKKLAPRRVNVVSPGVVDTDLWSAAGSEGSTALLARVSAAAGAPYWHASRPICYPFAMTNDFVTGSIIGVGGGGLL